MALNLKTLSTRSLSAAVFVVLLVGCVLWGYYSFTIFFFAVSLIGLNEFYKIAEKLEATPFRIPGFVCAILIYFAFVNVGENQWLCDIQKIAGFGFAVFPFIILAAGLFSTAANSIRSALFSIGGIIYAVVPFALLNKTVFYDGNGENLFSPWLVLGIIFLIWSNDTFAYLGGSLFGKNKMIERVSPGKTWEGTIIGVVVTFGISFLFNHFVYELKPFVWPVLGLVIPVLATIGDLVESKLKREAGIKDSGNIMPGHGGVLDRFDSLIFVSPFVFAIFKL